MESLNGKSVFVTGGTGFIGAPLCDSLVQCGARVFVLTRHPGLQKNSKVVYTSALSDMSSIAPEIIINLAGEPIAQRWTNKAKQKIIDSRLSMTSAIIESIKSSTKKPSLLINASAIGYYGTDEKQEFTEETSPAKGAPFSQGLCAAWESESKKAEQYGVRVVLLRIGAVLEKDGGMLGKLLLPFRLGLGGPIGHGRQWLSWIDRGDLINLILHAINQPSLRGPINAIAPNPVTGLEFARMLSRSLGRPCLLRTPAFVLRAVFGDMADEIMLEGQKVLPQKAIESGFRFSCPDLISTFSKILNTESQRK